MDARWPVEIMGIEPVAHLGSGGFGQVWLANQTNLRRQVAVKISHVPFATEDDKRRFDRECQALGQLGGHPHIIEVYTSGISNNLAYIVLQFVDGGTLDYHGRSLSEQQVRLVTDQLCQAVSAAHDRGVLHRDLKPENVFLKEDKTVILGDFGIARLGDGNNTAAAGVTGSMAFVAPEVLQGQTPSVQADVYGIGITIISAVLGNSPFVDAGTTNIHAIITNVINAKTPDLTRTGLSPAFQNFLLRAIHADPTQRPQTVAALRAELQQLSANQQPPPVQPQLMHGQQSPTAPQQPPPPIQPPMQTPAPFAAAEVQGQAQLVRPAAAATKGKGPLLAMAAMGIGSLLIVGLFASLIFRGGDSTPEETATDLTASEALDQADITNPPSLTETTAAVDQASSETTATTEPTSTETTRRTTELFIPLSADEVNSVIGATEDKSSFLEFDTAESEAGNTVCGDEFAVVGKTDGTLALVIGEGVSVSQAVNRFSLANEAEGFFDISAQVNCGPRQLTSEERGDFEETATRVESEVIYGDETVTIDFISEWADGRRTYARQVLVRSGVDTYQLSYGTSDQSELVPITDILLATAMEKLN